jgi:hypothetical protein
MNLSALRWLSQYFSLSSNGQQVFYLEKEVWTTHCSGSGSQYSSKLVTVQKKRLSQYLWIIVNPKAKKQEVISIFCEQPFYPESIPAPCSDERLPGNDCIR